MTALRRSGEPERDRLRAETIESSDSGSEGDESTDQLADPLSERELDVLALLAPERTNTEIANALFVAVGTVKSHVNNIYRKLGPPTAPRLSRGLATATCSVRHLLSFR